MRGTRRDDDCGRQRAAFGRQLSRKGEPSIERVWQLDAYEIRCPEIGELARQWILFSQCVHGLTFLGDGIPLCSVLSFPHFNVWVQGLRLDSLVNFYFFPTLLSHPSHSFLAAIFTDIMTFCTCATPESPVEAARPSLHSCDGPTKELVAPRRLVRKPSKLKTTMEVTKCRFGNKGRQVAPTGYEDYVPRKDWTPIAHAVYHGREAALHHFLQSGISTDDTEGSGIPLLCIAAACGHFEIAKILLEAGAATNACSKDKGESALHIATRRNHHDIIDLLLLHQVNPEVKTVHTGETALHYAAAGSGSLALVMKLLKFGAKYDVQNSEGQTPAAVALQACNLHAAVAIINMARGKRSHLAKEKDMLLQHVQKTKERSSLTNDLIADVFAATCDPDSTVLVEAIKKNDSGLVEMFLDKGADPHRATADGLLPIFVAVKFADLCVVKLLVKHGADIAERGPGNLNLLQVLFKTCSTRSEDSIVAMVDYLLAKSADASALYPDGKTLLHRTVSSGLDHAKVAKLLLRKGIEIDAKDNGGNAALHLAASNGHANIMRLLLDARADMMLVNSKKQTPLLCAIQHQQWHIVPLLAIPPSITSWDAAGSTALHHTAQSIPKFPATWADIAVAVKCFCERGVCRSMRDRSGATPLIQAVKTLPEEGLPIVETLLIEGGKERNCVNHEDHKSRDALYYAAILGKPAFVEVLLNHGAIVVLEDWTDSKKKFKLPADSKARILELFAESERSRQAQSLDQDKRADHITAQDRSSSAMSGYHADREAEHTPKPNRESLRKVLSAQHLQVPALRQKPAIPSASLPSRTSSVQYRPGGATAQRSQAQIRSRIALSAIPINNKAGQTVPAGAMPIASRARGSQLETAVKKLPAIPGSRNSSSSLPSGASSTQQTPATSRAIPEVTSNPSISRRPLPEKKQLPNLNPCPSSVQGRSTTEPIAPIRVKILPVPAPTSTVAETTPVVKNATKPATPKLATTKPATTKPATKPAPPVTPSLATTPVATSKPVQPARADSGVSMTENDNATKPLPTLDRSKNTLDSSAPKAKRQSGDELAGWLAISNMLDRL